MKKLTVILIVLGIAALIAAGLFFACASCEAKANIIGLVWQYSPMTGCWFDTPDGWFPLAHWVVR